MKNKNVNILLGFLVGLLIIFLVFAYGGDFSVNKDKGELFDVGDGTYCENVVIKDNFRFCNVTMSDTLNIYRLEFYVGDQRILHTFRSLPEDLEDIKLEKGLGVPLLIPGTNVVKEKIYLSVDPNFSGDEVLASLWLPSQIFGRNSASVFKMDVNNAFSGDYEGNDHPIKNCNDVTNSTAVVEFREGESKIQVEDNCIVVYGQNETDLTRLSEKLVYNLLEIVKSDY